MSEEKNDDDNERLGNVEPRKWHDYITVEVTMFLYMMAFMLTTVVEQVFFVYKACTVDHKYSDEICRNIQDHENIKKEVQRTVSLFHQWDNIAGHVIPIILALFLGSWSDKRGRKLPLMMGLFGKLIYSVMIIVNANQPTWPLHYVIYTATIPMAFTGADLAIFAACFAYISDISSVKNRTLRITVLDAAYLSTMPTGVAIGSQLFKLVGHSFGWMFAINASLLLLSLIYTFFRLKWQTTDTQRPISDIGYSNLLGDFFNREHLAKSLNTIMRPRAENRRAIIWILLFAMGFYTYQRDERPMLYLFVQLKLNWDTHIYSWFRTYQSSVYVIMMLLGIPIMTRYFKWRDTILIMVGATSHALGRIFFIFASSTAWMYVGASVASLGPIVAPVIRSMASKAVPINERGVLFSILSVFDNAIPFMSAPLYSQLYNATIDTYPQAIFWLTFGTQVAVFGLAIGLHVMLKGQQMAPPLLEKKKLPNIEDNHDDSS